MTVQDQDQTKDDELILFDNVLVPNIDNELVFGLGDDSYMNSFDFDGSNIAFSNDRDGNNNNNDDADNAVVEDPDHEELQNLLLDLDDDDFPSPTFASNTEVANVVESLPVDATTPTEETIQNFSRETNFKIKSETTTASYAAPATTTTPNKNISTAYDTQNNVNNTVSPDHAREARRQRMEIILRRRGLLGKLSNSRARREQNNAAAEHAVKAVLSANTNIKMEDVENIANQLVMDMNLKPMMTMASSEQNAMPRSVSFADGSELAARPPSPVLSAVAVKPVAKRNSRRSRGDFPVPDEATSSFTPTARSSSVPPRKKAPISSSRSRKKTSASDCTVDPTLLPDGDDPESRRQRRLIRNRMSAQLHRERKREAMDALQRMIQERDLQIQTLEQQLTQVHQKNSSLEEALAVVRSHYGAQAVENLITPGATPPASPPHLVNNSSDSSSSDDDENSTSSAPSSVRVRNNKKRSSTLLPTATVVHQQTTKPNKKKKLINAVMMAPLCVCAIIGCLSVIPFKNTEVNISQKHVIKSPSYRQRISNNHPYNNMHDNSDARRRLLSIKSSTGDILLDQILGEASSSTHQLQEWVINPVENYPAQWKVDQALKYPTPWSYTSHESLFDFRSHALSNTMRSYDFLTKNNQEQDMNEENLNDNDESKETKSSKLRGSSSDQNGSNSTTTSPNTEIEESDEITSNENTDTSLVSLSQAISVSDAVSNKRHSVTNTHENTSPDATKTGSNYLFCPSAHAKFTPDFLRMTMGRDVEAVTDEELQDDNVVLDSFVEEMDAQDMHEKEDSTEPASNALVPANSFAHKKIIKDDKFIYKAVLEGDDPYMSILLPASAVSGGTITPRRDEPWIELGCQVLSAKIVNGVDFLEADKENITS